MANKVSDLTRNQALIDALALQYVQGKATGTATEYAELFVQAKYDIKKVMEMPDYLTVKKK